MTPDVPHSDARKIDPSKRVATKPDGSPDDNDRVEIGPTPLAFREWDAAGIAAPNLAVMREFRLRRLAAELARRDYAAVLLFDPLNIRYASDTTNMQLWNAHDPFRACLVTADGHMIVWDFKPGTLLTGFNPLIRETRGDASFFYFVNGDGAREAARDFAAEVDEVIRSHCGKSRRLAVDKIPIHGLRALDEVGFEILDGEELMEKTRSVKGPEEIAAMRCAIHACEQSLYAMQQVAAPGLTEAEIWAVLHAENIKRGGEWIETRLLASGPRTNPWFQECGPRVVQDGDLLAFDTDLVGCYGICTDISRTWHLGDRAPTSEQKHLHAEAHAQIADNMALLAPGTPMRELTFGGRPLPEEFVAERYACRMHGVGLCDEWPKIAYPEDWREGTFDYALEPGMVLAVETYIGAVGGREGVKLEDQVLITEDGHELLSHFPFDQRLMG